MMNQTAQAVYEKGSLRLTSLLADLMEGQQVTVTVEPAGDLEPGEYARRHAELLRQMDAEGMIVHLPPPADPMPKDWKPLVLPGEPLSETLIKMRREE